MSSKQKSEGTRRLPLILGVAAFAAVVYSVFSFVSLQVDIAQKSAEYEALAEKLRELETQNEQLERYANDEYRMDYIEQIARDELDYSYSDEKIYYFVPSN